MAFSTFPSKKSTPSTLTKLDYGKSI